VNEIGFGFGTGFPFWCCDDASGGDRRLDFLCVPITGYEIGYRSVISGSAPEEDPDQQDLAQVEKGLEIAAHYHLTMNMFYHPVYIARSAACRAAIEALLVGIERRGLRAAHMGNDSLCAWWAARSRSGIEAWERVGGGIRFRARCEATGGMVVQVPLGEGLNHPLTRVPETRRHGDRLSGYESSLHAPRVSVDGRAVESEVRWEFGQVWMWAVVPEGEHEVEVRV
jgi:hypothetical protein